MLPLGLLGLALLSGFAGYQYSKAKHNDKNKQQTSNTNNSSDNDKAKAVYNYYGMNDGEYGNTLFNSQKKKRSLFQDESNTQINQVSTTRRFI